MIDFTVPSDLEDVRRRGAAVVRDHVHPQEPEQTNLAHTAGFEPMLADLRKKARSADLWTPHLPPEWGGLGLGALGMALVSEELGVNPLASLALNCMAPDEGNMHLLLEAGTPEQQDRYLKPLAAGEIRSCFAMTEPEVSGSDPRLLEAKAVQDGDGWVIDGHKWFTSGAIGATFSVVVAMTDPEVEKPHRRYSLFLVPTETPGWEVVRDVEVMGLHDPGGHPEVRLSGVRVPADAMLGERGEGFVLSQKRLGMGRIGHAMRWIGLAQRALDMAAGRSLQREMFGKRLAEHQGTQFSMADSAMDLYASRLMVLHAAWKVDQGLDHRQEISMVKAFVAEALGRVVDRAVQVHGALGVSGDSPLETFYRAARLARIYDGPSEVHRMLIARNMYRAFLESGTTKRAAGGVTQP
jgi:alkylation response protein AidB-like acyl-CoA dehydrogenase